MAASMLLDFPGSLPSRKHHLAIAVSMGLCKSWPKFGARGSERRSPERVRGVIHPLR